MPVMTAFVQHFSTGLLYMTINKVQGFITEQADLDEAEEMHCRDTRTKYIYLDPSLNSDF